jgi:nucleotide-binding universal stress UspA family protein
MSHTSFSIKKILVPIDFSETSLLAIEHAGFTAQLFKAELVLLHVMEKHWEKFNIIVPNIPVEKPSGMVNAVEKRLEDIAFDIQSKYGVKSECITTDGTIFHEIISIAKEYAVDLIMMGTHGVSGFVELFLGSNAYKITTLAGCPVLSVQVHSKKLGFQNIVLPIDNSAHSRQKVHHAIVLANHFGAVVHIVGLIDTKIETDKQQLELKVKQVEDFLSKSTVAHTTKYISGNNQAKLTLNYATEINADLIVIMGDQEENLTGRFLGAYAQQIVNHSKIPTLTIPPEYGYLSTESMTNPY